MRRATITLTDELETALDAYRARSETPPSLNVLMQAALRHYLGRSHPQGPAPDSLAEPPSGYDDAPPVTTVRLDPEAAAALGRAASREGLDPAELAAHVLRQYLDGLGRPTPRGIGAYRSGREDVSVRAEEILRTRARSPRR